MGFELITLTHLRELAERVKSFITKKQNKIFYAVCSTAADVTEKTVECDGFVFEIGSQISIRFTVTNTVSNPTLNVNNTGAFPIYYRGSAIKAGYLAQNHSYLFAYNGAQYELVGDVDTDTTYSVATTTESGLMSSMDKETLEKIAAYYEEISQEYDMDGGTASTTEADYDRDFDGGNALLEG